MHAVVDDKVDLNNNRDFSKKESIATLEEEEEFFDAVEEQEPVSSVEEGG